ncbi:MAG: diphosphomevalonate decarboxylase [Rhodanobacter sp.]
MQDPSIHAPRIACAQAQPNIALVKYWGKREGSLNLPASGSLSVTLEALHTRTVVAFDPALERDELWRDGAEHAAESERVAGFLDLLRARAGSDLHARVTTHNNFPTGAGLASSASGFAALAVAGSAALGLALEPRELSALARRGSGSAARSIFGGFVCMDKGVREDGADACARPLLDGTQWPLCVVVAVTSTAIKAVGSGPGMEISRRTSPFHAAWLEGAQDDLVAAGHAITARDFAALAQVSEHSCLKMHAVMLASQPALVYWNGATVECLHVIRSLRERDGLGVFFTIDAGPQVKAVCLPQDAGRVAEALRTVAGVQTVLVSGLGAGARLIAAELA